MTQILRRHLLALMLGVTTITFAAPAFFDAPAMAKNGSDDNGSDDSDDDNGGSSGSGSDDSNDDDSDDDSNDDDSNDDNGSDDPDDDDDSNDDDDNDDDDRKKEKKAEKRANKSSDRPTAVITLSAESLALVKAGTHVVIDQLGRVLEVRIVTVNGQQVIRVKPHGGDSRRKPGPISDIKVVPASPTVGNDDGTPDQGSGDN